VFGPLKLFCLQSWQDSFGTDVQLVEGGAAQVFREKSAPAIALVERWPGVSPVGWTEGKPGSAPHKRRTPVPAQ
jgi:hypothetical protein